jgi:RHS repeat-associated protein
MHKDHLGSTRVMTKPDKTVYDSIDYLPFGEQLAGGTGTSHKFTGKERDAESGLDDFGARYVASTFGRFMSADEDPPDLFRPQSLNRYAYVLDNPLAYVDPNGKFAAPIHIQMTEDALRAAGYRNLASRHIAYDNAAVDSNYNDEKHAYMHSQAPWWQSQIQAERDEKNFVDGSLDDAAAAVLKSDQHTAEVNLGEALHDVQDEKHEWTQFNLHQGSPQDLGNPTGRHQAYTDFFPTQQQFTTAMNRTVETVMIFENKVRALGKQKGLTNEQIEKLLTRFKNGGRDPVAPSSTSKKKKKRKEME